MRKRVIGTQHPTYTVSSVVLCWSGYMHTQWAEFTTAGFSRIHKLQIRTVLTHSLTLSLTHSQYSADTIKHYQKEQKKYVAKAEKLLGPHKSSASCSDGRDLFQGVLGF